MDAVSQARRLCRAHHIHCQIQIDQKMTSLMTILLIELVVTGDVNKSNDWSLMNIKQTTYSQP